MLNFLSLIIKVSFSMLSIYALLFFSESSDSKSESFKTMLLSTLLISSFLCIIHLFSTFTSDYTIYISGLFISYIFIFLLSKDYDISAKFDFYFMYAFTVGISMGYIVHSLIILVFYFYIKNNFNAIDIKKENNTDESFYNKDYE